MAEAQIDASAINDESPAQKQARLRRERREAKIKGAGSARLDKITQLSGRAAEAVPSSPPAQLPPLSFIADPDEGDISHHEYPSGSATRPSHDGAPTEADIRQLLRSAPPSQDTAHAPGHQQGGAPEDPMAQILQQMMGGTPGAGTGGQGGLPPGLAALMGAGEAEGPGTAGQGQHAGGGESTSRHLWTVIHAVFALALGIYITALTTFNGAQISRTGTGLGDSQEGIGQRLFWVFATAEVVLQSTRYFLELGSTSPSGWLGIMTQILPEPWKSYVGLTARYSGIWTTAMQDAMVVVFVLGSVAWWKGVDN
ncbi:MAG: hypothetical protein Q9222_002454 [Ikaeria aurantiellina]